MARGEPPRRSSTLAEFLRARKDEILTEWTRGIRGLKPTRTLSHERLIDHLPHLLERIAAIVEELEAGGTPAPPHRDAERHAQERLFEGFDLSEVVSEFAVLRECIARVREQSDEATSLRWLHQAIDRAITASIDRYVEARDRALKAVDRVSSAALESRSLDELLRKLLAAFIEALPVADTAAILLREGDQLRLHATVGLERELEGAFTQPIGEGFAGTIAAQGRAMVLDDAAHDPLVRSEEMRRLGVRALYGVPLRDAGEILGVAHMGSTTAGEFSEQDKRLFEAMAERATSALFQHQLRAAAERRAAELDAVIEAIPDAVIIADTSGNLRYNSAALALTGIDRADLERARRDELAERLDVRDAATAEKVPREGSILLHALAGRSVEAELVYRHAKTGRRMLMRSVGAPIRLHGRIVGAVVLGTDITDRKRVERELADAAHFRERFIAILGHDLRNPLNAIRLGVSSLLGDEDAPERVQRTVDRIDRSAARMERMIDDIVDFTHGRMGGGIPLRRRAVVLRHVARTVIDELRLAYPGRTIALDAPTDCDGTWDPDRLAQVLSNLTANALQHGTPGSPVTVRLFEIDDGEVGIEVHNEGKPIPPDRVSELFEPFRRRSGRGKHEGLGLGLFITKAIVDAHHGTIDVRSSADEGTRFTVRLPRQDHQAAAVDSTPPST